MQEKVRLKIGDKWHEVDGGRNSMKWEVAGVRQEVSGERATRKNRREVTQEMR
jgi:hypothetical protein